MDIKQMQSEMVRRQGVLVQFRATQWSGRAQDKEVATMAASQHQAKDGVISAHKALIDPAHLTKIREIVREAREVHMTMTIPWEYTGVALLPGKLVVDYDNKMGGLRGRFDGAVNALIRDYDQAIDDAKTMLGDAFDFEDYPSEEELRAKYEWEVTFSNVPETTTNTVRQTLDDAAVAVIESRLKTDYSHVVTAVVDRITDTVGHFIERLKAIDDTAVGDKKAALRQSTVDKLDDLRNLLPGLNITDDPAIAAAIAQLNSIDLSAKALREEPLTRKIAGDTAASVLAAVRAAHAASTPTSTNQGEGSTQ